MILNPLSTPPASGADMKVAPAGKPAPDGAGPTSFSGLLATLSAGPSRSPTAQPGAQMGAPFQTGSEAGGSSAEAPAVRETANPDPFGTRPTGAAAPVASVDPQGFRAVTSPPLPGPQGAGRDAVEGYSDRSERRALSDREIGPPVSDGNAALTRTGRGTGLAAPLIAEPQGADLVTSPSPDGSSTTGPGTPKAGPGVSEPGTAPGIRTEPPAQKGRAVPTGASLKPDPNLYELTAPQVAVGVRGSAPETPPPSPEPVALRAEPARPDQRTVSGTDAAHPASEVRAGVTGADLNTNTAHLTSAYPQGAVGATTPQSPAGSPAAEKGRMNAEPARSSSGTVTAPETDETPRGRRPLRGADQAPVTPPASRKKMPRPAAGIPEEPSPSSVPAEIPGRPATLSGHPTPVDERASPAPVAAVTAAGGGAGFAPARTDAHADLKGAAVGPDGVTGDDLPFRISSAVAEGGGLKPGTFGTPLELDGGPQLMTGPGRATPAHNLTPAGHPSKAGAPAAGNVIGATESAGSGADMIRRIVSTPPVSGARPDAWSGPKPDGPAMQGSVASTASDPAGARGVTPSAHSSAAVPAGGQLTPPVGTPTVRIDQGPTDPKRVGPGMRAGRKDGPSVTLTPSPTNATGTGAGPKTAVTAAPLATMNASPTPPLRGPERSSPPNLSGEEPSPLAPTGGAPGLSPPKPERVSPAGIIGAGVSGAALAARPSGAAPEVRIPPPDPAALLEGATPPRPEVAPVSGGGTSGTQAVSDPALTTASALLGDRVALSRHVSRLLRLPAGGETRTQITLRPDGLGTVEIDLTTDPSGRLSVLLRVENPAVLQALRADRDLLLMSLDQTGMDLNGAQLDFHGFGAESDPRSDERGARTGPYRTATDLAEMSALPAGPATRAPLIGGGRIDLFT